MASTAPLIGLLGANVGHSRLPRLFMTAWRRLGVSHGALCVPLDLNDLGPPAAEDPTRAIGTDIALRAAKAQGFTGLAVTMPCKEHTARACDELDPSAAAITSVNCVQLRYDPTDDQAPPRLVGQNLDGWGAALALKEAMGANLGTPNVLMLGGGGVALAVGDAFARFGGQLWVYDIDAEKAEMTAQCLRAAGVRAAACGSPEEVIGQCAGIANCTPVGMHGGPPGSPIPDELLQHHTGVEWVFDAVCYPTWTPLLRAARRLGRTPVPGMRMNDFIQREMFVQLTGMDASQIPADIFPSGMAVETE